MSREWPNEHEDKDPRWPTRFAIIAVIAFVALAVVLFTQKGEGVDHQGCPKKTGPSREVVVLLDTSDPLGAKHKAELKRIVREMTSPAASGRHDELAVRKGERVTLYRLESTELPERPILQICHPGGNPEEKLPVGEKLTQGTVITEWRWERFVQVIEAMFPAEAHEAQPSSRSLKPSRLSPPATRAAAELRRTQNPLT